MKSLQERLDMAAKSLEPILADILKDIDGDDNE